MQNLNSDCLLEIFKHCQLKEQLILTRVCEDFRTLIVDVIWKTQLRQINIFELIRKNELTDSEIKEILVLHASYLEELTIVAERQPRMYTCSKKNFWWPEYLFDFSYPKLKFFKCIHPCLEERHIKTMAAKCEQLESLQLGSNCMTGRHIVLFKNLSQLHVRGCAITIEHLAEITTNLNLKHLSITANKFNMNDLPANIAERMINLMHLTLIEPDVKSIFIRAMKKSYNLKVLHVNYLYSRRKTNGNWLDFFETCGGNIKVLKLLDPIDVVEPYTIITNITETYYKYLSNLQILCIDVNRIYRTCCYTNCFSDSDYITFFYEFFNLIVSCTKLEHIYMTAVNVSNSKFKLLIFDLIKRLNTSEATRKRITIHLQRRHVKDNSKIKDIIESNMYTGQNIVELEVDYRKLQIANQKAKLEFEFY